MSSINKYESLKIDGTLIDRIKYVLSLSDKSEIEKHLKESFKSNYDDAQTFIFLSISTKNDKNLLEIFKTDSLPVKQRIHAGKCWIQLQKDVKQIENFLVETINEKNCPRYLKHQILRGLNRIDILKKSSSFFFDLASRLTETNNYVQYNIAAHTIPFCTKEQILNLFSRWSIKRMEHIDRTSAFYSKLVRYQPSIIIHLIKEDLNEIKINKDKFSKYFTENLKLFELIYKKVPKELIHLAIQYLNQLEKHQRLLPAVISENQKYFFKKVPEQFIELITIVGSTQPGQIKYVSRWSSNTEIDAFVFPRSFSIENYVKLFNGLYETCKWSSNNTIRLLKLMLPNQDEYSIKKQRKWLIHIVIEKNIGKDLFIKKFLKEGDETFLNLFKYYPEYSTLLSRHLLSQYERKGIVESKQRLSLIRYQSMTQEIFDEFLSLFKKTGSDVDQRKQNYPLLLQCAVYTNELFIPKVLQWIQSRFTNEQLMVIEQFLTQLNSIHKQFQLQILLNNSESIQSIIDIAINHLQQSTNTLQIIYMYGINLLQRAEHHSNKEQKQNIQAFATKIIKQCYSKNNTFPGHIAMIDESYVETRHILANIFISDLYPNLVSKCMVNELNNHLDCQIIDAWRLSEIDSFLKSFFTESLPSSTKLQSSFKIDTHSTLISFFLKTKSTKLERVNYLINKLDRLFFLNEDVQRIALRSQQSRQLIDQLIQDEKCFILDKLTNEQSKFASNLNSTTQNLKFPGLNINLLNSSSQLLTGKQQEHITNIILNDYLQDKDVSNVDKLKSLRILRRLTHTYNETLKWFDTKQDSPLSATSTDESGGRRSRGAAVTPLDDVIICLPSTFDLTPQNLIKQFQFLKTKLNAKNAKFISDALLNISRKIPDEIFLKDYLEFIRNEQFQKLGITANKEILRLLISYASDSSLIKSVIKPLWDSHPHQDVRACLILTLLHFVNKSNSSDDETIIWNILEEAANDDYLPVVQSLFASSRGKTRWPLTHLIDSSDKIFERFVNRIQFKILDHPTLLQARSLAWSSIDYEHSDMNKLIEKAQQLCIQFDKDANTLWIQAFQKIIQCYKQQQIFSSNIIIDTIQKIMSRREEIDSKENANDNQHDLPVYHRIQRLLTDLSSNINQFDNDKQLSFRSLTQIILQFDKTLSPLIGKLLIKIAKNKEDIENLLENLQKNLPENYFEHILTEFSTLISKSCPFIQQLHVEEKLQLAQWFIKEKNRPLFVFDLLKNNVFSQPGVDKEQCQILLQQIRQSENLFLRQQAMEYTVPWNEEGDVTDDDGQSDFGDSSDMEMS